MISHRVPIEEMDQLYAAFDARVGGVEKVFVQTRFRWVFPLFLRVFGVDGLRVADPGEILL
jgi:hypothetical protein